MSRNLLHKTKLEDFKVWLDAHHVPHRPGRGSYQALQVNMSGKWCAVYERNDMPEHYTTEHTMDSLVRKFCRDRGVSNGARSQ